MGIGRGQKEYISDQIIDFTHIDRDREILWIISAPLDRGLIGPYQVITLY